MKRFFVSFLALILVAAGGLFALTFVDVNQYKPELQALAQEATGRTLQLDGALRIGFSLRPTVVVERVKFGNAAWGSAPNMFTAERVAVRLSLLSLLTGAINVRELDVRGATLLLEQRAHGAANWELASRGVEEEEAPALTFNELPHIIIDDLHVTYVDGRRGEAIEVSLGRVDVAPRNSGLSVGVRGTVDDRDASVSGFFVGTTEHFTISNLHLAYDQLSLSGKLEGKRPSTGAALQIDGELDADELNIDALLDESDVLPQTGLFSDRSLPFDVLAVANGEIDVSIKSLIYHELEVMDLQVSITLKDGKLIAPIFAEYEGHRLEARISASEGARPRAGVTFSAPGFNIGEFLKQVDATDLVDVRGNVGFDLSGNGRSVKALMGSLSGKIDIATGRGRIDSSAFELIAEDLLWALIPKGDEKGVAQLTCFINELDFSHGVGKVTALALVTDKIRTSGTGTIDLAHEQIDVRLAPRPNDPGLLSLATPLNITGPLTDPSVLPDTTSLLGDIALSVGAGLLTGGVGAILPLISTDDFDAESAGACLQVIAGNSPAPSDGGVLDRAGQGAGDVIRGVGDVLTSPFK